MRVVTFICMMAGIIGLARSAASDYSTCDECVSNNFMWTEDQDCNQKCEVFSNPSENFINTGLWRRRVYKDSSEYRNSYTSCEVMKNSCSIIEGIKNPSLEEQAGSAWEEVSPATIRYTPGDESEPEKADGNYYGWFCGIGKDCSATMSQAGVTIPEGVTHLSFYLYLTIDRTTLSSFTVYVDNTPVFRMDLDNSETFPRYYVTVEIDIRKYADGKEHSIKFYFNEIPGESKNSMAIIDYIQLLSRAGNDGSNFDTSSLDYCSSSCPTSFLNKGMCSEDCNNFLCGYANGNCDDNSGNVCFRDENPSKRASLEICADYKAKSCCSAEEVTRVNELYKNITAQTKAPLNCHIEDKCLEAIENILCAPCTSNTAKYIKKGKIIYCNSYTKKAYDVCSSSYIEKDGLCKVFSEVYPSYEKWVSAYGGKTDYDNCYSGNKIDDDDDGLGTTLYIIIAVAALVVIIIIIVIIAVIATVSSHKKKAKSQQDIIVTEDGVIVGQPVVITDEFGNIIGQEMAPVGIAPTVIQDGVIVDGEPVVIQDGAGLASVDVNSGMVLNSGMDMGGGMVLNSGMDMGGGMVLNSTMDMNSLNMTGGMMMNSGMNMNSMNMTGGMNMNSMNMTGGMDMNSMNMTGGMNMN